MTKETEVLVNEITKLREIYKQRYGKEVFSLPMPCVYNIEISTENLYEIMKIIVDTGENISEGYTKYILKNKVTLDGILKYRAKRNKLIMNGGNINEQRAKLQRSSNRKSKV